MIGDGEFTLDFRPQGMPTDRTPRFRRLEDNHELNIRNYYLVRLPEADNHAVGRVVQLEDAAGEGRCFRFLPANHLDDVKSFNLDNDQIVAQLID